MGLAIPRASQNARTSSAQTSNDQSAGSCRAERPWSAQVQVHDLRRGGQRREVGLEVGVVVAAGATVEQHDRRPLAHGRAIGYEGGTVDVEPQLGPVDVDLHVG